MIWNLVNILIELTYTLVFWTVNTSFVKKIMFTKLLLVIRGANVCTLSLSHFPN
jgi:hypothetical protein